MTSLQTNPRTPIGRHPEIDEELDLHVLRKRPIADDVIALDLERKDRRPLPHWSAGAHIDVLCGDLIRQYSLCGDPDDLSTYSVAVRREKAGRGGSRFIHDVLMEGNALRVRGPRNNFPLVESERYLFIAGGIGITPILPMVARAERSGAEWRLMYGGRDRPSMAFRDHLINSYPGRVSIQPQDQEGLLDLDQILGNLQAGTVVYCCGPEGLLQAVEDRAQDWTDASLHVERFTPRQAPATMPDRPFEVELARSERVLQVEAGESVLDVLDKAGVAVLSSCTEGTCGTCETVVLAGLIDHRDSVLSPAEQQANDVMFVCVSRALGARIVLDL